MSVNLTWPLTIKANQPVLDGENFDTFATTTTPAKTTKPFTGDVIAVTAIGADHFVSFTGTASTSSAIVPAGTVLLFVVDNIPDPIEVSARTASGSGFVSVSQYI
jgi:hypothetical protein